MSDIHDILYEWDRRNDTEFGSDLPDPNCDKCAGTGVRGGCREKGCPPDVGHAHTMWFCECVTEDGGEDRP